MKMAKKSQSKD